MKINNFNNLNMSFKSLYTVKLQENPNKIDDVLEFEDRYCYQGENIYAFTEIPEDNYSYNYATTRIICEDSIADDEIEIMLANRGIKFTKTSFEKLLNSPESIKERIVLSNEEKANNFQLVEVDREKFDMCYEKYDCAYIGKKGSISLPERTERFKEYLKTGKEINASVVYITDNGEYPEITFQDGRHRYAYMRDINMDGIPIAMNEDSIRVAQKYGLLNS